MNTTYIILGVIAAVLLVVVLYLATKPGVRREVARATRPASAPHSVVPDASYEQRLTRLVAPAFEDAVDKARASRLHAAMLASYISQRHPDEITADAPAPAVKKPVA